MGTAGPAWGWRSRAGFVNANGGKLYVESLPGQGATFVFELPLDPVVPAQDGGGAAEDPSEPDAGQEVARNGAPREIPAATARQSAGEHDGG